MIQDYAHIVSGNVQAIIRADSSYIAALPDHADYVVTTQNVLGWSYDGSSFSPPSLTLAQAQQKKLAEINLAVEAYVAQFFDLQTQFRFKIIYDLAVAQGLTNRAAYIQPALTWISSVIGFVSTLAVQVMSQTDPNAVEAITFNFNSLTPPNITLLGAISIQN